MAKSPSGSPPGSPPATPAAPERSPIELVVEQNKSKFVLVVLGLLVVVCGAFLFYYLGQKKEAEAAAALGAASTAEGFNLVALEHAGTLAGGNALLRSADLLVSQDPDAAVKKLLQFTEQYAGHPRYAQALVALGTAHYQKARLDEAEAQFEKVLDEHRESDVAPLALVSLGDIAWDRGDTEKARQIYESLAPEFPANAFIDRTDERLRLLKRAPPTGPSDRQKALKEEEDRLRL
jgi:tetratricopeptide (TPR) repeat protein